MPVFHPRRPACPHPAMARRACPGPLRTVAVVTAPPPMLAHAPAVPCTGPAQLRRHGQPPSSCLPRPAPEPLLQVPPHPRVHQRPSSSSAPEPPRTGVPAVSRGWTASGRLWRGRGHCRAPWLAWPVGHGLSWARLRVPTGAPHRRATPALLLRRRRAAGSRPAKPARCPLPAPLLDSTMKTR